MNNQPGKMQFPCDFTFKVIGRAATAFEGEVLGILHQYFPQLSEGAITLKHSKQGKYLAMTIHVMATSQDQLDQIYRALNASPHVLFAL